MKNEILIEVIDLEKTDQAIIQLHNKTMNELLIHKNLNGSQRIMLSERSLYPKEIHCMIPFI